MRNKLLLALTCTGLFAACGTDIVDAASTADSLEAAQTDFCAFRAQADACRQTFDACVAAEGADLEACRTALHGCLPPPPPRPEGGHCMGGMHDGGMRGAPPPMGAGGPGGHRGPGGGGHRPGPQPEPAAVQACRDALTACQAADAADTTCVETERACVRAAFRAAFEAACADLTTLCESAPADACARLTQRCTEGVDGRVDAEGGVCSAPPPVVP